MPVPDVVVAASGNLANIYFTAVRERMSLEGIARDHPRLMPGLVRHEGIGFIMVRSEKHGSVAIGRDGVHHLADGTIEGLDPLVPFGSHAAHNLRRLDGFDHVGDLLVISMYDPSTEEVAPFEHQVGAHGGLGGAQTKAFVMYPTMLEAQKEPVALVGAEQVNTRIQEWLARARALDDADITPGIDGSQVVPLPALLAEAGEA